MLKSDAPLLVNPKPSWHKLSWFAGVHGQHPALRAQHHRNRRLAIAAREHFFAWADAEGWTSTAKSAAFCTSTATRRALTTPGA
jgi:D-amino-acid dehydrogenase